MAHTQRCDTQFFDCITTIKRLTTMMMKDLIDVYMFDYIYINYFKL